MSERDLEAPEADALEQDARAVPDESADDADADLGTGEIPVEVDPADRAEQQISVGLEDDDYR